MEEYEGLPTIGTKRKAEEDGDVPQSDDPTEPTGPKKKGRKRSEEQKERRRQISFEKFARKATTARVVEALSSTDTLQDINLEPLVSKRTQGLPLDTSPQHTDPRTSDACALVDSEGELLCLIISSSSLGEEDKERMTELCKQIPRSSLLPRPAVGGSIPDDEESSEELVGAVSYMRYEIRKNQLLPRWGQTRFAEEFIAFQETVMGLNRLNRGIMISMELFASETYNSLQRLTTALDDKYPWGKSLSASDSLGLHNRVISMNRAVSRPNGHPECSPGEWVALACLGDHSDGGEIAVPQLGRIIPFLPGAIVWIRAEFGYFIQPWTTGMSKIVIEHSTQQDVWKHAGHVYHWRTNAARALASIQLLGMQKQSEEPVVKEKQKEKKPGTPGLWRKWKKAKTA